MRFLRKPVQLGRPQGQALVGLVEKGQARLGCAGGFLLQRLVSAFGGFLSLGLYARWALFLPRLTWVSRGWLQVAGSEVPSGVAEKSAPCHFAHLTPPRRIMYSRADGPNGGLPHPKQVPQSPRCTQHLARAPTLKDRALCSYSILTLEGEGPA